MSCSSPEPPPYCSPASPELKLYQAFVFSVPVFFTFILLLLFYLFYLKRRRANWQSLRMRANNLAPGDASRPSESGLKKEVREMLPIVVFKESFLIRETQCSVCLGDYQSDERLQKIPPCGHTFHVDCIDHWLSTNTTCPLCRVSLLPTPTKNNIRTSTPDIDPLSLEDLEAQEGVVQEGHLIEQVSGGGDNSNNSSENGNSCSGNKEGVSSKIDLEAQSSE